MKNISRRLGISKGLTSLCASLLLALVTTATHAQQAPAMADTLFTTQPVQLVYFKAWQYYGGGQLHWATLSEGNSADFVIEQSTDAHTWHVLSTMEAHPSYPSRHNYVYMDAHIRRYGVLVVHYRVQQRAQDGTYTYSPVRSIWLEGDEKLATTDK